MLLVLNAFYAYLYTSTKYVSGNNMRQSMLHLTNGV